MGYRHKGLVASGIGLQSVETPSLASDGQNRCVPLPDEVEVHGVWQRPCRRCRIWSAVDSLKADPESDVRDLFHGMLVEGGMEERLKDVCSEPCVHGEVVRRVAERMVSDEILVRMAELFKALGEPARVRILEALSISEMCVRDLAELLAMSPSAVSHQLRVLRTTRIVKFRKVGKNVVYSLDDEHIVGLLRLAENRVVE